MDGENNQAPPYVTLPPSPVQPEYDVTPRKHHYLMMTFGVLVILSILAPGGLAALMVIPIAIFGFIAGIRFLVESVRATSDSNPMIRLFGLVGGLGVGAVIFIACVMWGAGVAIAKNPT